MFGSMFGSVFGSVFGQAFGSAFASEAAASVAVLRVGSTASVMQRCPGTVGSPSVEQFVNPVVISPAFIIPVVTNQVVISRSRRMPVARARPGTIAGDHKNAQLCFACRSRAKVSSFPLADRLAERMRAVHHPLMVIH